MRSEKKEITKSEEIGAWSCEIKGKLWKADEKTRRIESKNRAIGLKKQDRQATEEHKKMKKCEREVIELEGSAEQ